MKDLVSIIVRTRNEERWITQCLGGIADQTYKEFEVIIVDNESSDKTIEKAKQFKPSKIVTCSEYLPGKALNAGIKQARGKLIACISGHCIPANNRWLENLARNFDDPGVAGVYGRQEPMSFTSDADKRDLALVFGLDRKVQAKDSFFHNANSMIRKAIWDVLPFDESVTNIEDRVWAKAALGKGYKIIYDPDASVYHYHGIHQNGNVERCTNVVRVLESLHKDYKYKSFDIEKMNIVALIPVRGESRNLGDKPLISYTIERALESKYIDKVIVSTDNAPTAALAVSLGAQAPFLRDPSLSEAHVDLVKVFQYSLKKIEELKIFPDLVVCLEATFPFRPKGLIDNMIAELVENGLDSVVASYAENKAIWKEDDGRIVQVVEGTTPRQFKEPTFIELKGVGCVTHPEHIRQGRLLGEKIGMYEVKEPYARIEVRASEDFDTASTMINRLFK